MNYIPAFHPVGIASRPRFSPDSPPRLHRPAHLHIKYILRDRKILWRRHSPMRGPR